MKKLLTNLKDMKVLSLLSAMLLLFTYLSDMRRYIYDNINATLTFIRLGSENLSVSTLLPVMMTAGLLIGAAAVYLSRKHIKPRSVSALYIASGLFAAVALLFTPYNLQLLMPDQNLQNITSINLIAVIVFTAVDVALFSAALGTHILSLSASTGMRSVVAAAACTLISVLIAILTAVYNWSFVICVGVYSGALALVNIVEWIVCKYPQEKLVLERGMLKTSAVSFGIITVAAAAVMTAAYFIIDNAIVF